MWDDDHIRSLLVSISLSYPIGAVMTLVAGNPDVNFKARLLEGVTLAATPAPEMLLLDGQQRLTSLFQALKSRAPVCTRDRRGNELHRHYYASINTCIDPSVDREDEGVVSVPADRADGTPPRTVQAAQFQAERLLTLRTRNSAAYKGLYALQMKQGGRDFKTGQPIDVNAYLEDAIDVHHIFPRHWCASHDIEWWVADCIVNKTALDAHTNRRIGGNAPSVYLSRIESGDGIEPHVLDGFLRSHDIDPVALRGDDFAQFFNQRFESLLRHAERAMGKPVNRRADRDESPFAEQDLAIEPGVRALIEGGESAVVEFKSTARRNLHTEAPDQAITWAAIKTIAAFMNTHGGTLLVGVDDHGQPVGIELDYPLVKGGDRDGWELWLTAVVKTALGTVAATDLSVRFCTIDDRTIARIDVRRGAEPVFASRKGEPREVFLARLNNSTEELSGPALLDYRRKRWPE